MIFLMSLALVVFAQILQATGYEIQAITTLLSTIIMILVTKE